MAEVASYPFGRVGSLANVYRFPRSSVAADVADSKLLEPAGSGGIIGASSGAIALTGTADGVVRMSGVAAGSMALAGAGDGVVRITCAADGTVSLTGASTGAVLAQGGGDGTVALTGAATGLVVVNAGAEGSLSLIGTASGNLTATTISGTASGVLSFTGQSFGAVITYQIRGVRARPSQPVTRSTRAKASPRTAASRSVTRVSAGRR